MSKRLTLNRRSFILILGVTLLVGGLSMAWLPTKPLPAFSRITCSDFGAKRELMAHGHLNGLISLRKLDGQLIDTLQDRAGHSVAIKAVKWSPDETQVISLDQKGLVCIWDVDQRRLAASIQQKRPPTRDPF